MSRGRSVGRTFGKSIQHEDCEAAFLSLSRLRISNSISLCSPPFVDLGRYLIPLPRHLFFRSFYVSKSPVLVLPTIGDAASTRR